MPTFAYSAIDQSGKRSTGEIVATDQVSALDQIVANGLTPLDVNEGQTIQPWWNRDISFLSSGKLKPRELEAFFSALSAMLTARTPLPKALRFCADLTSDKAMKAKLQTTISAVEDGTPLADALTINDTVFPDRLITMIRLGETSNNLGPVVNRAAHILETEAQLRREVQQALIYPIILLLMSIFVLSVLVFYLAPTLAPVFASANAEPPSIIGLMVRIETTVSTTWPILLIGGTIGAVSIYALRGVLLKLMHRFLHWFPVIRRYLSKRESLRLCQTLYLMLGSGGQLADAIKTAANGAEQGDWKTMLAKAHQDIEAGETMTAALLDNPLIDPMTRTILTTGEESDQLVTVLGSAIATLQSQTSQTLSQTVKLLTPLLTLVIGLVVGAIILSTISAIMDLNDVVF